MWDFLFIAFRYIFGCFLISGGFTLILACGWSIWWVSLILIVVGIFLALAIFEFEVR